MEFTRHCEWCKERLESDAPMWSIWDNDVPIFAFCNVFHMFKFIRDWAKLMGVTYD